MSHTAGDEYNSESHFISAAVQGDEMRVSEVSEVVATVR
jgi:hypothetical protein